MKVTNIDISLLRLFAGDAPPPYTALAPAVARGGALLESVDIANEDDKYAFLSSFDTKFLVDDSGSMTDRLWQEVADVLHDITPICIDHAKDGIDLHFTNHKSKHNPADDMKPIGGYYGINALDKVQEALSYVSPAGTTPTSSMLRNILKPYITRLDPQNNKETDIKKVKPINIIVITNGCPTDNLESEILHWAQKLDNFGAPSHQVGIQFFQVGSDKKATEALRQLDDEMVGKGVRDMVDTATWDCKSSNGKKQLTANGKLKVVLGAVIRRLDRIPSAK